MEVGTFLGATACAAAKNTSAKILCIDTWDTGIQPATGAMVLPESSMSEAWENVLKFAEPERLQFIQAPFLGVQSNSVGEIDFAFYDGPHDRQSVSDFVVHFAPCFGEGTILLFDDANWTDVKDGADAGLRAANLATHYKKQILNEIESPSGWWNGLYIVVVGARLKP